MNFEIRHYKKVHCSLNKVSLYKVLVDYTLATFTQLFRWTAVGRSKYSIYKMIGLQVQSRMSEQFHLRAVPRVLRVFSKVVFHRQFFLNELISKLDILKMFIVLVSLLACIYSLLVDHRLAAFH